MMVTLREILLRLKRRRDSLINVMSKVLLSGLYNLADRLEQGRELRGETRIRYRPPENDRQERYFWHYR
jgi:hypothetical protein